METIKIKGLEHWSTDGPPSRAQRLPLPCYLHTVPFRRLRSAIRLRSRHSEIIILILILYREVQEQEDIPVILAGCILPFNFLFVFCILLARME